MNMKKTAEMTPEEKLKPAKKESAKRKPKPTTTTGLVSLADFIEEAKRLEVWSPELESKFKTIYNKNLPNEGMRRMQCNNLLRNAVKRAVEEAQT